MGEAKVTRAVPKGVTKGVAVKEIKERTAKTIGKTVKEITREAKVQRNYKDTVSRMLFREPENALSLYNALNGTDYTDASQIIFNMLDNAIYMGMQNDISFLIMNEDLKEKCPVLKQYTQYVEQVRCNSAGMPLEQAVEAAIEYCIRHNILKEFLSKQKAEVIKMSIFEYDEEREIELIRRDEREIGEQIGKEIGQKIGEEIGAKKERQKAEQELNKERQNTIESIVSLCKKFGSTKEQATLELQEKCGLTEEKAKEKAEIYWKAD